MAHRTNAADPGGNRRHFPKGSPFAKFLEAPKLGDVKPSIRHLTLVIQVDRDFGVTLDSRDGVNDDSAGHGRNILAILEGDFSALMHLFIDLPGQVTFLFDLSIFIVNNASLLQGRLNALT